VREPFQQFVAEVVIVFALLAQAGAVERNRAHLFEGARIQAPEVGRYQPRPAEYVSALERFYDDWWPVRGTDFEAYTARPDQIKVIGLLSLTEQVRLAIETDIRRTADQQTQVIGFQAREEVVFR
jgi:hypothetical protein